MENIVFLEEVTFTIALLIYLTATILFFVYVIGHKDKLGKYAVNVTIGGIAVHTFSMIFRIIEAGRLPFSNQFEFASSFTWGIVLIFIIIQFSYKFTSLGAFVMPLAFLMMMYASMQSRAINPLMPALQSSWLTIHVGTAVIAYGSFAVACGLSIMYLINEKKMNKIDSKLPDVEAYDYLSYRVIAFGYLMLTVVIITGAIWAKYAWSRYWAWDPKETWSLITWLIYSVYLHLRFNRGWKGRPAAWFAVIGFASVIFTFIGVNVLLPGLHSYK